MGYEDETWWSRVSAPGMQAWAETRRPLRLVEQTVPKGEPKALACYGLLLHQFTSPDARQEQIWLRFVEGRPVSGITTQFLTWCCEKLWAAGHQALLLVWDNAGWHISHQVRTWIRTHNRQVKQTGGGVRLIVCPLPSQSPWLNPIEPKWMHGKRRVVEPDRLLAPDELRARVFDAFGCAHEPLLSIPDNVP